MKTFFHKTFSSLKIRNYRLYYIGQVISVSGTFLQTLAQDWLVLKLTNSGTLLGLVLACQFAPLLLLGSYGGVIADRFPKRVILYFTQTAAGILALLLGLLVITNSVHLWMVFIFATLLGIVNSVDNPTRQSFVSEMVGKEEVRNAVSLWAILISMCRVIGPAIAGILIATVGIGLCFILNAISYIPVVIALFLINKKDLFHAPPVVRAKGQIREGFRYARQNPLIFTALVMMAIIGTITFEWSASMPLFAKFILNGGAGTYSILTVAMGTGMLVGGFLNAATGESNLKSIVQSAFFFGIFILIAAITSSLPFAFVAFIFVGVFSIRFSNITNSTLQINSDQKMRGRVMALWSMGFIGSTAIGGPLIGWIGQAFGARWSLATGGLAALVAALYGFVVLRRTEKHKNSVGAGTPHVI